MIDTVQLREALTKYALAQEHETGGAPSWSTPLYDAARVLLAQMEAGALIITPDEGKWPAVILDGIQGLVEALCQATLEGARRMATWPNSELEVTIPDNFAALLLDALRDATPDGET